MITCPNCGFSQPDDGYCANCGIDMNSYVPKKNLFSGPVAYMALLVITVTVSSFYIYSIVKEHVLEQKSMELSGSIGYSDLSEISPPTNPTANNSNINETQLAAKKSEVVVQPFESGNLKVYYVSLARTSPVLQNANMSGTNSGVISNLASYFTSDSPEVTNTINVIDLDTWNVPANSGRVARVFNISKALPESDENVGLNLTVDVDSISKEMVNLQASTTFISVEAVQSAVVQPASSEAEPPESPNTMPIPGELGAESINDLPEVGGTESANEVGNIQPANGGIESVESIAPIITFNTMRQSASSNMQTLNRGDALFVYNIIPRRELLPIELNLMPNLIAGFINQGEFLTNNIDFVIFVEYEPQ